MKCWYDGLLQLRKGNRLKITKGYNEPYKGHDFRVTLFEDLSTVIQYGSIYSGNELPEPIIGRVLHSNLEPSTGGTGTRFIVLEEGNFVDYVFVKAGELKKGQDALKEIFTHRVDEFVKICDPYINEDTIKLVSNAGNSITIDILTEKIKKATDLQEVKKEADKLPNKLIIKEGINLHDRFILTKSEGWVVGHSLKDFGTRISSLTKLASPVEWEDAFDENWTQSQTIYGKK